MQQDFGDKIRFSGDVLKRVKGALQDVGSGSLIDHLIATFAAHIACDQKTFDGGC
jgi:hypothetical protein